jgi:hypothetical protein
MTISNGSTIDATDLATMTTASLALIRADNAALPGGGEVHFYFQDLVASTAATRRRAVFIAPYDMLIETLAVETADHTAASTTTATLTGDGAVSDFPIEVSGTTGAGNTALGRLLFDGSKTAPTSASNFARTSQAVRVWPKGTTLTLVVSTTSTATPSQVHVVVVFREFYARS